MLLTGFSLLVVGYLVYAFFLGGIDGLPPLPISYLADPNKKVDTSDRFTSQAAKKLKQAFGAECPELQRQIQVELRSRNLVLATDYINIMQDKHRVQLTPFSAAIYGKSHGEEEFPEINTIRGEEAILIFDRPIENFGEAGDRKIVGAELHGHGRPIHLINNRRTEQKNDDLEVLTYQPLFYSEKDSHIWSDGRVTLIDTQPKTQPTQVDALGGMDLYLIQEQTPPSTKVAKSHGSSKKKEARTVNGVDRVILRSDVTMHFDVDPHSGFLSDGSTTKPEKKSASAPEKHTDSTDKKAVTKPSHVVVTTGGPFTYLVEKDFAVFESAKPKTGDKPAAKPGFPGAHIVKIVRTVYGPDDREYHDELTCDRLELQFRKRADAEARPGKKDSDNNDREIETARALARPSDPRQDASPDSEGSKVFVNMDSENLHAFCDELIYHCAADDRGPETILKAKSGQRIKAFKDAHTIETPELQLIGANKKGEGQYAFARGPGRLDLVDESSKVLKPQYHANWEESLIVVKDKEKNKVYDLLKFTGKAAFIDDDHMQELHANKLMVWLEQPERLNVDQPQPPKDKAGSGPRQQPHKLEGFEKVWVKSPDLNVRDSDYLIIRFKNEPESRIPDTLPSVAKVTPDGKSDNKAGPQPGLIPGGKVLNAKQPDPGPDKKDQKPFDVTAKRVAVYVVRTGPKNELSEAVAEGNVFVHQDPSSDKDKGVDISGELLHVTRSNEGDIMVVFGDPANNIKYAKLVLNDLKLAGPQITINQRDNTTEVKGDGAMTLPSQTNFDGSKNTKPGVELTVLWKDEMFFDGKAAAFLGKVNAHQEESLLICETLHVYLDKTVAFKQTDKKDSQGAKVERLVASGKFSAQDIKRDEKKVFQQYNRMTGLLVTMDNKEDIVNGIGPGMVDALKYGSLDDDSKKPSKTQQRLFLTRVVYQDRLFSNKDKDGNRTVKFTGNVEVYHFPSETVNVATFPEKLPKECLYLHTDKLTVYSKAGPATKPGLEPKTAQEMLAEGKVSFVDGDVRGAAPVMHYNQETEILILQGTVGNRAILQKSQGVGLAPQEIQGNSIRYNRKTGEFSLSSVPLLQGTAK
jgi:hypothetical protein